MTGRIPYLDWLLAEVRHAWWRAVHTCAKNRANGYRMQDWPS